MKGNRSKTGFQFHGKLAMSRSPRPAAAGRRCRVINRHRAQRRFGDGLIAEEVKDRHEAWMKHADPVLSDRQIVAAIHEAPRPARLSRRDRVAVAGAQAYAQLALRCASVMGPFTSSGFFCSPTAAERLKIVFRQPILLECCSLFGSWKAVLRLVACGQDPGARGRGQGTETLAELGGVSAVAQLVFRSALTPEHAEGRWTARRAFLQTAPAVGIRSCVILVNVSRAGFGLLYVVDVKSRT